MKKLRDMLRDCVLSFGMGIGIGLLLLAVFAAIGGVTKGLQGALEASRGSVLVVGGLLMIYAALLVLKGGNLPADAFRFRPEKQELQEDFERAERLKLFRCLPEQYTMLLTAIGILATSIIPESVVLYYL